MIVSLLGRLALLLQRLLLAWPIFGLRVRLQRDGGSWWLWLGNRWLWLSNWWLRLGGWLTLFLLFDLSLLLLRFDSHRIWLLELIKEVVHAHAIFVQGDVAWLRTCWIDYFSHLLVTRLLTLLTLGDFSEDLVNSIHGNGLFDLLLRLDLRLLVSLDLSASRDCSSGRLGFFVNICLLVSLGFLLALLL